MRTTLFDTVFRLNEYPWEYFIAAPDVASEDIQ